MHSHSYSVEIEEHTCPRGPTVACRVILRALRTSRFYVSKMQCGNAGCGYVDVRWSSSLLGIGLEALLIGLHNLLNKNKNDQDFKEHLEYFEKKDVAFKCNYLIKKRISRPLFEHELIFRENKKIEELLFDISEADHQFFSFIEWRDVDECPKCLFKRIRLFFRSKFEIVGVGVNDDRIEDFDLAGKEGGEVNSKYWAEQAEKMGAELAAAASRRGL